MSGNSVSSTNFGYFISEQISMMMNKEGHLDKMKKNFIYKNNPVFKRILENLNKGIKTVDWSVHDAMSNMFTNKTIDHSKQFKSDTVLIGLSYFANNVSKDEYDQSMGISGDRSKITTVKSPRYKNKVEIAEQLKADAETQQKIFDDKVSSLEVGSEQYNNVVNNFNSIYMNKIVDGKVVTPFNPIYPESATKANEESIAYIKKVVRDNELTEPISRDHVGSDKMYKSFNDLVESYYYTEAINRNALMELFAGIPLDRAKVTDKPIVSDVVKRENTLLIQ
jgi:hypothetical protein